MRKLFITVFFICIYFSTKSQVNTYQTPQELISATYNLMSFEAGELPDWDCIKNLFHKDATIVLRTGMDEMTLLNKDSFVDLWIKDINEHKLDLTGIKEEKIIDRYEIIGNIATCYVIYAISIPNKDYPPQFGIDCIHLIKDNDRWCIVSIVNEVLRPGVKPPTNMKDEFDDYILKLKSSKLD